MDELEARIEALERAVTEGDHDLSELAAEGETRERLAAVETELGDLADRVAELEAATQALRGYAGNVRAVNRDVEQRADAALAKAESLESALVGETAANGEHPPATGGQAGESRVTRTDGQSPGSHATDASATDGDRPPGGTRAETTVSTTSDGRAEEVPAGTDHSGHGGETGHERCRACGRPTDGPSTANGATESGATGSGTTGSGSGRRRAASDTDRTDDRLDGVFEADGGHENGDGGTFDRIRKML